MALATLSIDLEARLAGIQQGFDKAARLAEKNADAVEARYNRLKATAVGIGVAFAGAFSLSQAASFFRSTVDGVDALNDLADASGASIENISALEDVALRTGGSVEVLGSSLVRLNQFLSAATVGSQQEQALKRIGLEAQELRRIDPAIALKRVADALADYADDGSKARLVQDLFGRSVAEVAPLLKDLAEAGELNATVTTQQAEEASKFNKQLSALSKEATDLARSLSGPLVKGLNDFFTALNRARESDQGLLGTFGQTLQLDFLRGRLAATNEELERLAPRAQRAREQLVIQPDSIWSKQRLNDFAKLQRAADEYRQKIDELMGYDKGSRRPANEGGGRLNIQLPTVGEPDPKTPPPKARASDFAGTVLDPLTLAALKRLENTDTARMGQLRLELAALIELGAAPSGPAVQQLLDEIEQLDPAQRAAAESRARLNQLLDQTPTAKLSAALSDVELINVAFDEGRVSAEQWAEAARAITATLPAETERALEEMSEFTREFQRNVQNVLGDNLSSILAGDFDNIGQAWKNMLLGMVAQATAADLAQRLFGADGQSGWFAQLGSLFGFAKGGAFEGGRQITAFADGGVLTRPTFFGMNGGGMGVAGEAGVEGIFPLVRGPDGKLGVRAYGSGGGGSVTYNVAAGVNRGELVSALQLMSQQTEARVMNRLAAQRVI